MKEKNICKFIEESSVEKIDTHRFIYETSPDVMKRELELKYHRMALIRQGSGNVIIDGTEYPFNAGSLIFAFSGEKFSVRAEKDTEYMYIDFGGARAETLFARFCINKLNRIFTGFEGIIPLWHDSLCRASEINLDLVSEGILLYTFSRIVADNDEKNTIINKILTLTEENFTDPELSVTSLATELSYNAKYISHLFKEKMGIGYSEHLRNLRIKYAVSLLEHGIDSVKNVALLSGFTDPLYFSTVFKKIVGVSPKDYKKR